MGRENGRRRIDKLRMERGCMGVKVVFFFNDTATTEIYTLSLHDALPISAAIGRDCGGSAGRSGTRAAKAA